MNFSIIVAEGECLGLRLANTVWVQPIRELHLATRQELNFVCGTALVKSINGTIALHCAGSEQC